jgi:hypothetical protein
MIRENPHLADLEMHAKLYIVEGAGERAHKIASALEKVIVCKRRLWRFLNKKCRGSGINSRSPEITKYFGAVYIIWWTKKE